ncbi:MAG: hypothetical protein ACRDHO_11185, partial [Actinomycetota bacterium]
MSAEQTPASSPAKQEGALAPMPEYRSRERDEDRPTRKRLEFWDRIKLILLFVAAWLVMLWAAFAQFDPQISNAEAFNQTLRSYWWL